MNSDTDLGIFFREGIRDMLLAIDEANLDACRQLADPEVRIYRMGFAAAIRAVSTAFGITLPNVRGPFILDIPDVTKLLEQHKEEV